MNINTYLVLFPNIPSNLVFLRIVLKKFWWEQIWHINWTETIEPLVSKNGSFQGVASGILGPIHSFRGCHKFQHFPSKRPQRTQRTRHMLHKNLNHWPFGFAFDGLCFSNLTTRFASRWSTTLWSNNDRFVNLPKLWHAQKYSQPHQTRNALFGSDDY